MPDNRPTGIERLTRTLAPAAQAACPGLSEAEIEAALARGVRQRRAAEINKSNALSIRELWMRNWGR